MCREHTTSITRIGLSSSYLSNSQENSLGSTLPPLVIDFTSSMRLIAIAAVSIACLVQASAADLRSPWGAWGNAPTSPINNGKTCTVNALGNKRDDSPQILQAFEDCNNGGTVVFPEHQTYWIATKLNPIIYDVTVEWKGLWLVYYFLRSSGRIRKEADLP
jgi:hypothetical protein